MDNREQLQEALALGNQVNQLLRETVFLQLLQAEVNQYQDEIQKLSPEQLEEFRRLQTAKVVLLRFFDKMKGAIAAGEAAATKLNEPESKRSGIL
jgi:flagellar biosynthesis chaperone FliJ